MNIQNPGGLCLASVRISDDDIVQFQGVNEWVDITPVSAVIDMFGESYTDVNGVELDIRTTLEHFVLTEPQYDNVRAAESFDVEDDDVVYDERAKVFLSYFENYLQGVVDTSRRTN